MTLSAVGSVFSSADPDHHAKSAPPLSPSSVPLHTPTRKSSIPDPLSPLTPSTQQPDDSSRESGYSLSDISFTPPHPVTQLITTHTSLRRPSHANKLEEERENERLKSLHVSEEVSKKLHELASSLEHWTSFLMSISETECRNSLLPPEDLVECECEASTQAVKRVKEHLIPDIVSRLRYLSGSLDGTVEIGDYEDIFGKGNQDQEKTTNIKPPVPLVPSFSDDECLSPTLSPSISPVQNSSRLIQGVNDSDDSFLSHTLTPPAKNFEKGVLNEKKYPDLPISDWGVGRSKSEKPALTTEEIDDANISPIQLLYSKPSSYVPSTLPPSVTAKSQAFR